MTITFLPLSSVHRTASGLHPLVFRADGSTVSDGGAFGAHALAFTTAGVAVSGALHVDPEVPAAGEHAGGHAGYGDDVFGATFVEGEGGFQLLQRGYGVTAEGVTYDAGGEHAMSFTSIGWDFGEIEAGYGLLAMIPPHVSGFASVFFEVMVEAADLAGALNNVPTYGMIEGFRIASLRDDTLMAMAGALDRIELGEALAVILRELLAEGFNLDAAPADNFRAGMAVLDALRMSGIAASQLEAVNALVAAIAFGDLLRRAEIEGITEAITAGDAAAEAVRAAALLVDAMLLESADSPAVLLGALVSDGVAAGAETATELEAVEALRDGASFALHLSMDDGHYVAYVMNTESKAATEYDNYPFNSFAKLGGRYFGMTPDGIRELDGADDAGSPIASRFRLAMSSFGTGRMKRMAAAYLGYTSTGELRIKTITVGVDGVKQANYYRLHAQPADNPREGRVKIGQGLRSVYWGFEVEAIDGAAFMVDVLALHPLVVGGRIQGEGGGSR